MALAVVWETVTSMQPPSARALLRAQDMHRRVFGVEAPPPCVHAVFECDWCEGYRACTSPADQLRYVLEN